MTNATNNRIGGQTPEERNNISANLEINISHESSDSNILCSNYIGVDTTDTHTFKFAPDSAIQSNGAENDTTSSMNIPLPSAILIRRKITYGICTRSRKRRMSWSKEDNHEVRFKALGIKEQNNYCFFH